MPLMETRLVLLIVMASLASGNAITCTICSEMASDDASFPVPPEPDAVECSGNPPGEACDEGVTSCVTTTIAMHFTRDSAGPLTITRTDRQCGPWIGGVLPPGDNCAGQGIVEAIAGQTDLSTVFPPELGLTFQSQDTSICHCDSSDSCTPPFPVINVTNSYRGLLLQGTNMTDDLTDCPVVEEWFVDWSNSYACLSQLPTTEPFTIPGQILPRLSVSDIIQAVGAAWRATNLIEAEGEVCVRILPQVIVAAGGPDIVKEYCDPVLAYLREGTIFDALEHCRYILNITEAMSSYIPPQSQPVEPSFYGLDALRPFDVLDHIEKIIYNLVGVSFNEVGNVCTARVAIFESESTLKELVTSFLEEFAKELIPRGAEICNSWDDILNSIEGDSTTDIPGLLMNASALLAHLTGFSDKEALCQELDLAASSPTESPALDHVASYIANNTLSILTDVEYCSTLFQEAFDISIGFTREITQELAEHGLYQFTGFRSIQDMCQEVAQSFLPEVQPTPSVEVRLFGGSDDTEGTVEVLHEGQWGTVCDDSWDVNDATVVCRMLGFLRASEAPGYARFGEGTGIIWLDDVVCSGNEQNLADCQHRGFGETNCAHYEDAGVICVAQEPTITDIRLVGGGSDFEGRVEIEYDEEWGTICDDDWDLDDAVVVCRMLGFDGASGAPGSAHFGEGTGTIWLDDVECGGNESNLTECLASPFRQHNCGHGEDAGVICFSTGESGTPKPPPFCTITDIRLVGGSTKDEGRVEVYYKEEWGTVCDDGWDIDDASVVCRMLGFDGATQASGWAEYGQGSGRIWLDDVECLGDENNLAECGHRIFGQHNCGHSEDAGVTCFSVLPPTEEVITLPPPSDIEDIRLVGTSLSSEGRVEILFNGEWGTICDDYWGLEDAAVACKMLGFDGANSAPGFAYFGEGSGRIWLDDVMCAGNETNLMECHHPSFGSNNCGHFEDAGASCLKREATTSTASLRLIGGSSSNQGRVEILHDGEWGTVCDDYWGLGDAAVVCRMLGFDGALEAPGLAFFGRGVGRIWLDDVECVGYEVALRDCQHRTFGSNNCDHSEDAGAICFNAVVTTASPWTAAVRLVGGDSPNKGRVEILHDGRWGTVCDDYWGLDDATVVCRMLGFDGATGAPGAAHFGRGSDPIWLDDVMCSGYETDLTDCSASDFGSHNCAHSEDAGAICSTGPTPTPPQPTLRLVNGSSDNNGRVEILHNGEWGAVCDDYWDLEDAAVACRMLGFHEASGAPGQAQFGEASGRIWLDDVQCSGSEVDLADCSHRGFGIHNCRHSEDAGAICSYTEGSVRLEGSSSDNEGRVEILYNGKWGTVCDNSWSLEDAAVVCRMLGYCAAVSAPGSARFGEGVEQIWLDDVRCSGEELSLLDCPHRGIGVHNCGHSEDAGVVCFTPVNGPASMNVRLMDGSSNNEGRVEILHDGQWGTVCDDSWGMEDATVVCKMLGFCTAVSAPGSARFGPGSDPIWLDDVRCTGNEIDLVDCQHRGFGTHNCAHYEDAGVICLPRELTSTPETTAEITTPEVTTPLTTTPSVPTPTPTPPPRRVRLVGGNVPSRGRVEVTNSYGHWGTICDTYWSRSDANVVCRMLGYEGASSYSNDAEFGQSIGRILLDDVDCRGWESNIASCQLHEYGGWYCDKDQEVGVVCNVPEPPEYEIRLVGGSRPWEGRVELFYQDEWGTICSRYWGKNDGDVACKMLGFSSAYEAISPTGALYPMPFGEGTGTIHFSNFRCDGTEENLADCSHSAWGDHRCYHYEDAGLICNSPDPDSVVVRLVNGTSKAEGRVEVLYDGEFGTVCDDLWDLPDAIVLCKMLGYEGASEAPDGARFGEGTEDIVLDDVMCQGSEDNIAACSHRAWGDHNCNHGEDASAVCTGDLNLPVRLVNGNSVNEGRVEIYRYGAWGSVCDDFWDLNDGHVVCRMLGYQRAERIWWGTTYGPGTGRILLDTVECNGSEATLDDCDHQPWGVHDCNHYEDAGVVCV